MCYNCLSILENIVEEDVISNLKNYFVSLTPNNRDLITVSKITNVLNITNEVAVQIILKCEDAGILQRHFGIRCPQCGMLIKELLAPNLDGVYINKCYSCDEEICITENDIVILFKLVRIELPFDLGQQSGQSVRNQAPIVAREDTFEAFRVMCKTITKDSRKKRLESYEEKIANEKKQKAHKKAVRIANRNRRINIGVNIISVTVALIIIYTVYKKYGFEKLALFVSFTAFIIPFGCNYIIKELFITDVTRIEENLLEKRYR